VQYIRYNVYSFEMNIDSFIDSFKISEYIHSQYFYDIDISRTRLIYLLTHQSIVRNQTRCTTWNKPVACV